MMKKLNVSIIGFGHLGKWHAEKVELTNMAKLHAIVDMSEENRLKAKKKFPNALCVETYEEVLKDSDVFFIITPTSTHYSIFKELLNHNKHIFCEKPMTASLEEADELRNICKTKNVRVMIGHSERCHQVWENLDFSTVKKVRFERVTSPKARAQDVSVIDDLMVHDVDLLHYLFKDELLSLIAKGEKIFTPYYDYVSVNAKTKKGLEVEFLCDRNSTSEKRGMSYWIDNDEYFVDLMNLKVLKNGVEQMSYEKRDHLLVEHANFYESVYENKDAMTTIEDGHKSIKVLDAIKKSLSIDSEVLINK